MISESNFLISIVQVIRNEIFNPAICMYYLFSYFTRPRDGIVVSIETLDVITVLSGSKCTIMCGSATCY